MSMFGCEKRINFFNFCLQLDLHQLQSSLSTLQKLIFSCMVMLIKIFIQGMWKSVSHLQKFAAMNLVVLVLVSSLFVKALSMRPQPTKNNAQITVMGLVYCDICSNNTFSSHSYFLPGAEVQIACNFRAFVPKTREQVSFSVNRTTDKHGVYRLEIPSVDGIKCAEAAIASSCQASLVGSSSKSCNIPGYKTTTDQITIKSRHPNLCIYSFTALNFKPSKKDAALCGE